MKYYYAPTVSGGSLVLLGKESGGQIVSALPHDLDGVYSPLCDNQTMVVYAADSFVPLSGWTEKTRDEVFEDYPQLVQMALAGGVGTIQIGDGQSPYYAEAQGSNTSIYEVSSAAPFNFVLPATGDGMIVIVKVGNQCSTQNPVTISPYGQEQIDGLPSYLMTFPLSAITCASTGSGWIIV